MKQLIQDLKKGDTILEEVPAPLTRSGEVLIRTTRSLVSLGTERMLVEFGKANLLNKARQQPDKVKMVFDKMKSDGLLPTLESVQNKLAQPMPLGYCNVGEVIGVGKGVTGFKVGDRVASNGSHAEVVSVPQNLVAKIPDEVNDDEASFTVIGAIALQGIRLVNPTFGETIVVLGLGLIGQLAAQLLIAAGCRVIGFDFDPKKVELARSRGVTAINSAEQINTVEFVRQFTGDTGADGVLITASSKSNEIISQAANMSRKRGRIVLVGVVGLNISRADFYEKELSFQVSCSYGPGRYDQNYEKKGEDYPIGFVRWTEKRNFEAVLQALEKKQIDVRPLISERVHLKDYQQIYSNLSGSHSIASILMYEPEVRLYHTIKLQRHPYNQGTGIIGIIGAGNFTSATILPSLRKCGADIKIIASSGGLSGTILAKKFKISQTTTDYKEVMADKEIDLVCITTRHHLHAPMIVEALKAKKHVFAEKPLALYEEELDGILEAYTQAGKTITIGFNRRFSPFSVKMKQLTGDTRSPINIVANVNAGFIPPEMWIHDRDIGGGRVIGEACHFIDLCTYLTNSKVVQVCMNSMGVNPEDTTDNVSILLRYENGSNAVINYFSNGSKAYSKERIELYSQNRTLILDNWRKLKGYGFKGFSSLSLKQNKGHFEQFNRLTEQVTNGGDALIPFDEIINTTRATFAAIESLQKNKWVSLV